MRVNKELEELNSLQKVQVFIDTNNISSRKIFRNSFPKLYSKCQKRSWLKDLKFKLDITSPIYGINTSSLEEVQQFIIENSIKSRNDFRKRFSGLYLRVQDKNLLSNLIFPSGTKSWGHIQTLEDAQKFIDKNNIISSYKLRDWGGLYDRCRKRGWIEKLNFQHTSIKIFSWINICSIEDANSFLKSHNIKSRSELLKTFPGLVERLYHLGLSYKNLEFEENSISSVGESYVKRYIEDCLDQKELFNYLKLSSRFIIDFSNEFNYVIPDFLFQYKYDNYWIEYNGMQHYRFCEFFHRTEEDFIRQLRRDEAIRDFCKNSDLFINYIEIPYVLNTYDKVKNFLDRVILDNQDPDIIISKEYGNLYII